MMVTRQQGGSGGAKLLQLLHNLVELMGYWWFIQKSVLRWAVVCQLTCVTTICNSISAGWRRLTEDSLAFIFRVTLMDRRKLFKRLFS